MREGMSLVSVAHNFETAHRLPFLGGKCQNLHGHSWKVEVGMCNSVQDGGINDHGISIDFGLAKTVIRKWIDTHLDHGTMLGRDDLLARDAKMSAILGKVFFFGVTDIDWGPEVTGSHPGLPWPTVEAVARMLGDKLQVALHDACGPYIYITHVRVQETATNCSVYLPDLESLLNMASQDVMVADETV